MNHSELRRSAAQLLTIGFDGLLLNDSLKLLVDGGVAGVILFGRNIQSPAQVAELIQAIKGYAQRPIYVGLDQEGGRVQRLKEGFSRWPPLRQWGATGDEKLAWRLGRLLGAELRAIGVDVNFAPVLDVDTNPQNPVIGDRSLGSDPHLVARLGISFAQGLESAEVASCGKHFPGHGDTAQDSHLALPRLKHSMKRLREIELVPFMAWSRAELASLMTAHVVFEPLDLQYPATMSRVVLTDVLRGELGYQGLVFSDDIEMKALADHFSTKELALLGLGAGVDQFICCHSHTLAHEFIDALTQGAAQDQHLASQLDAAGTRVGAFLQKWAKQPEPAQLERLQSPEAQAILAEISRAQKSAVPVELIDPTSVMTETE